MFRCLDCQNTYNIKPEYCECGNNIFEEIISQEQSNKVEKKEPFLEQYPQIKRFIKSLDVLSVSIFILCIILSILAFVFIKPTENSQDNINKKEQKIINKIPSIDDLWVNNTNNVPSKKEEPIKQIVQKLHAKVQQKRIYRIAQKYVTVDKMIQRRANSGIEKRNGRKPNTKLQQHLLFSARFKQRKLHWIKNSFPFQNNTDIIAYSKAEFIC